MGGPAVIAILDNRDSFVLNIRHRLEELGAAARVLPSHGTRLDEIQALEPTGLIVSPGPQGPDEAGVSTAAIRTLGRTVPVLGICLGHQCIAVAFGLAVRPNPDARHGRSSPVRHDGRGLLEGVDSPFDAGRYHALAADEPEGDHPLEVSARVDDAGGLIMGLRHRTLPIEGVQFHPESVLTPAGYRILANFARSTGVAVDEERVTARMAEAKALLG
jgi:anthranilate synthase/aminodeoxychorismate synthase-like glutamine amidotransferase